LLGTGGELFITIYLVEYNVTNVYEGKYLKVHFRSTNSKPVGIRKISNLKLECLRKNKISNSVKVLNATKYFLEV